MTTLSIILLCIGIYAFIGLIVGLISKDPVIGCFWIFYMLGPILDCLSDIDMFD